MGRRQNGVVSSLSFYFSFVTVLPCYNHVVWRKPQHFYYSVLPKSPGVWRFYVALILLYFLLLDNTNGNSLFSGETSGNESDAEYLPKSE